MSEDVGIIVTQNSVPVKAAADYQKSIDSRWRFLDISFEQEFQYIHADSGSTHYWVEKLMDHNLGYLPAFTYHQMYLDFGGLNPLFANAPEIIATKQSIYARGFYVSGDPTTPIICRGFLRVFGCDITAEYSAPVELIFPGNPIQQSTSGVKVLQNSGAGMRSTEMSDYSINTQAKALAIQQTGLRTADSFGTLTVTHNIGYPPTYFLAFTKTAAAWQAGTIFANPIPGQDHIYPMEIPRGTKITANSTQVIVKGNQAVLSGTYALLITKEPAELAL